VYLVLFNINTLMQVMEVLVVLSGYKVSEIKAYLYFYLECAICFSFKQWSLYSVFFRCSQLYSITLEYNFWYQSRYIYEFHFLIYSMVLWNNLWLLNEAILELFFTLYHFFKYFCVLYSRISFNY
jgi:hypothetical protein